MGNVEGALCQSRQVLGCGALLKGRHMTGPRRQLLVLAAAAALVFTGPRIACAQGYPSRPVHLIVGFAAGNGPDIVARLTGEWLSRRLGQQIVVENRVGAASDLAVQSVVKAPPDGYTLLQITPANAINTNLSGGVNFIRDVAPVASVARGSFVVLVAPSSPAKTLPELIRFARANPDKINLGSPGTGSAPYLSAVLFKMMTGIDMLHVPYRSTSHALTELLGGRVQLVFADMSAVEFIKAGNVLALAVTTAVPQDILPGVPTVGEFVPGYEASTWYGIGAPRDTPAEIIDRLNNDINAGLADPDVKARLAKLGFTVASGSPADFGRLIAEETEKWAKVTKFAGAQR
jgi:tripartite-type tricarboxylate transporter receptor subunit TctC